MEIVARRLFNSLSIVAFLVSIVGGVVSFSAYGQSVKLAWDGSSSVVGYNIFRSQQSAVFPSTPLNGAIPLTTNSYTDFGVQSGTSYYYVVTAVGESNSQSGYSNQVLVTIPMLATNKAPVVSAGPDRVVTLP